MRGSRNSSDTLGLAAFRTLVANDVDEEVYMFCFISDLQICVKIFAIGTIKTHRTLKYLALHDIGIVLQIKL